MESSTSSCVSNICESFSNLLERWSTCQLVPRLGSGFPKSLSSEICRTIRVRMRDGTQHQGWWARARVQEPNVLEYKGKQDRNLGNTRKVFVLGLHSGASSCVSQEPMSWPTHNDKHKGLSKGKRLLQPTLWLLAALGLCLLYFLLLHSHPLGFHSYSSESFIPKIVWDLKCTCL